MLALGRGGIRAFYHFIHHCPMIKYLRFRPGPKRAGLGAEVRAGQAMKTPILNCTVANKNYVIDADRKKKKKPFI